MEVYSHRREKYEGQISSEGKQIAQNTCREVRNSASPVVRNLLVVELSNGRAALYKFTLEWNASSHIETLVQPYFCHRL